MQAHDIVVEFPTVTNMYAPKQACPRDLGYWYCDKCTQAHLEEQSELDFPIQIRGCDKLFDNKTCGKTHLGYKWCSECKAAGRIKLFPRVGEYPHIGEFEVVGVVGGST